MQIELCLVLDTLGQHRLVLESGTEFDINNYTSKNFDDSMEIREKYKKEIDAYLESKKDILKNTNKPDYNGRIAIVIPENVGREIKYYQRKVLYKKHIVAFKELLEHQLIMVKFSEYEKGKKENGLVSDFFHKMVRRPWIRKYGVKTFIRNWISDEKKKQKNYFQIVRDLLQVYEYEREQKPDLPSCDEIYLAYQNEKEKQLYKRLEKRKNMKLSRQQRTNVNEVIIEEVDDEEDKLYMVNGNSYTIDELHLLDLDDIKDNSDYIPDGVRKK